MINFFANNKKLIYFLRNIERTRKEGNKPFTFIIYGEKSVDLTIFDRVALNYFNLDYDNKFGFIIHLAFNKNKENNEIYFSRFKSNKYFDSFTMVKKDGNDNYLLDCENDICKTETITLDILKNVFNHKRFNRKQVTLY